MSKELTNKTLKDLLKYILKMLRTRQSQRIAGGELRYKDLVIPKIEQALGEEECQETTPTASSKST
jgi:hypothetical protein